MTARQNLLIHFLDREVLDLESTRSRYRDDLIAAEVRSALKVGLLFTPGSLLLPLSSYFESELAYRFSEEWGSLFAAQELQVVASELDYGDFIETKREQYKREPKRHPGYYDKKFALKLHDLAPSLVRRTRSSTADIGINWRNYFADDTDLLKGLWRARKEIGVAKFERTVVDVPRLLGNDPFIWDFVKTVIPVVGFSASEAFLTKELISRSYIRSYLEEFDARVPIELRVGQFRCGLRDDEVCNIRRFRHILRLAGIDKAIESLSWSDAIALKHDATFSVFAGFVRSLSGLVAPPRRALEAFIASGRKTGTVLSANDIQRAVATLVEKLKEADVGFDNAAGGAYVHEKRDLTDELSRVLEIAAGRPSAGDYEVAVARLFTGLFAPVLTNPRAQDRLNEGRKRVDLTLLNRAMTGFFGWLPAHQPCNWIFVECKNYSADPGNPELDQLAGRFSRERGRFGFLVCRTMQLEEFMKSCGDTAAAGGGFIVPLQDADLIELVRARKEDVDFFELPLVADRFKRLCGFAV